MSTPQRKQQEALVEARRHAVRGNLCEAQQWLDRAEQFGAVTSRQIRAVRELVPVEQPVP